MKRLIYVPAINEMIPEPSVYYRLPVSQKDVVDCLCDDDFTTAGETLYDSISGPMLAEPFIHHFAGWEAQN